MTPQEILAQIEKAGPTFTDDKEVVWLISRIKELEVALSKIAIGTGSSSWTDMCLARKALTANAPTEGE